MLPVVLRIGKIGLSCHQMCVAVGYLVICPASGPVPSILRLLLPTLRLAGGVVTGRMVRAVVGRGRSGRVNTAEDFPGCILQNIDNDLISTGLGGVRREEEEKRGEGDHEDGGKTLEGEEPSRERKKGKKCSALCLSKARFELAPSEEERHLKPPPWTARPSRHVVALPAGRVEAVYVAWQC